MRFRRLTATAIGVAVIASTAVAPASAAIVTKTGTASDGRAVCVKELTGVDSTLSGLIMISRQLSLKIVDRPIGDARTQQLLSDLTRLSYLYHHKEGTSFVAERRYERQLKEAEENISNLGFSPEWTQLIVKSYVLNPNIFSAARNNADKARYLVDENGKLTDLLFFKWYDVTDYSAFDALYVLGDQDTIYTKLHKLLESEESFNEFKSKGLDEVIDDFALVGTAKDRELFNEMFPEFRGYVSDLQGRSWAEVAAAKDQQPIDSYDWQYNPQGTCNLWLDGSITADELKDYVGDAGMVSLKDSLPYLVLGDVEPTTPAPTTESTTAAPTTESTTPAPTTESTTAAPTTESTTPAPTTESTTAAPTTESTTAAPTTESTTAAPTTKPAAGVNGSSLNTGGSSGGSSAGSSGKLNVMSAAGSSSGIGMIVGLLGVLGLLGGFFGWLTGAVSSVFPSFCLHVKDRA
ncbi:hypothetical protein [Corynebacterium antarcticum]|uniref:hypothetical protein n=1 Tax=Corynebacterium antarcticum TaxID=2800405 RepID=UPI002260D2A8|nr:hypothetical protein [Corynebacterium antarcticum]MCX7539297.1 hypothetical protein [Corynebacterium antarcticum]